MGHVFKPKYTKLDSRTGKRVTREVRKWYVEYYDAHGERQRVKGYEDKRATEQLLADLQREADRIRAGILPADVRRATSSLIEQVPRYLAHLRAKNSSTSHLTLTEQRIRSVIAGCQFHSFADVTSGKVERYLESKRNRGKHFGITSSNHYLTAIKGFVRWLAEQGGSGNPLAKLRRLNAATDRRHKRRALSPPDFTALVRAAAASPVIAAGLSGPDRAMLYLVAAYTGLRASELASLTAASFHLKAKPLHVVVEAGYSKRRRLDRLPVPGTLAARLRKWLPGRKGMLWSGTWASRHHAAEMLRIDLEAADIPYRDESGRVFDFHALRSQFITGLARARVSLIEAQKLARHSTPNLTVQHYTHLELEELGEAADKLPDIPDS